MPTATSYRPLKASELEILKRQKCYAKDWSQVQVVDDFDPNYLRHVIFSGDIRLGRFDKEFTLEGGLTKHSGIYYATIHNCTIADNVLIDRIHNYIANYHIGADSYIENVNLLLVEPNATFGNGVEVAVLNEVGGREVAICDRTTAQMAYMMAMYRHNPQLIRALNKLVSAYVGSVTASVGRIGAHVVLINSGTIKNVKIGDYAHIVGATHLCNGSINSNIKAPVKIGDNVIADDFIISSGAIVESSAGLRHCFVGQACHLASKFSAHDSLFFSNCQMENGEACAIFAGPYTVTMHKSSLLIAGVYSFCNAGSGSNQSNHMYKLGPIHQGVVERGSKTTSDSYILWPSKVGAFSLVMGRHVNHSDTSDLPFSYLIEKGNESYIVPGVNLRSVGTIRDAQKWPKRDKRSDPDQLDLINFNLLSPYTIGKMARGIEVLRDLQRISGITSDTYAYQSAKIKNSALRNGLKFYHIGILKFLGNSLISRLSKSDISDTESLRAALRPTSALGEGDWIDVAGLIMPKSEMDRITAALEQGVIDTIEQLGQEFATIHAHYYDMEWSWAASLLESYLHIEWQSCTPEQIIEVVEAWKEVVISLDKMVYEDAKKEFSLHSMAGFGVDGDRSVQQEDFAQVRGLFEQNAFVAAVEKHIVAKSSLATQTIEKMKLLINP